MRKEIYILGLLSIALVSRRSAAQYPPGFELASLCELQTKAAPGEVRNVRVEGIYLAGVEGAYLVAMGCSDHSTLIEFALKSHHNWTRLQRLVRKPYEGKRKHIIGPGEPVLVVFEGEIYGPPVPDPKLPEAIRKVYHPGWDSNSMTKLVVQAILSVKPLPEGHPCASPKGNLIQWPCFQHNPVPRKDGQPASSGLSHEATDHAQGTPAP
jgi:hypothetical protein